MLSCSAGTLEASCTSAGMTPDGRPLISTILHPSGVRLISVRKNPVSAPMARMDAVANPNNSWISVSGTAAGKNKPDRRNGAQGEIPQDA